MPLDRSFVRRIVRRARRSRRFAVAAALAWVALAVLAVAAGVDAWRASRRRPVRFDADPPHVAMLRDLAAPDAAPLATHVPSLETLRLAPGEYSVQGVRHGGIGDATRFAVRDGERYVSLDGAPPRYAASRTVRTFPAVVDLGRRRALVEFTEEGISLWTPDPMMLARYERPNWSLALRTDPPPEFAEWGEHWPNRDRLEEARAEFDEFDARPWVVESYVDLDGDATGDVILAGRDEAAVGAVSGATGRPLWFRWRGGLIESPTRRHPAARRGAVLDVPLAAGDVNGDGADDLLVHWAASLDRNPEELRQWLEMLSGATGEPLWTLEIPHAWSIASGGPNQDSVVGPRRWTPPRLAFGYDAMPQGVAYPPRFVRRDGRRSVALAIGSVVRWFDPANGRETHEPFAIAPGWSGEPKWHDLDGDGDDELLVAYLAPVATEGATLRYFLRARTFGRSGLDWQWETGAEDSWKNFADGSTVPDPLAVDLDGDGAAEVLMARPTRTERRDGRFVEVVALSGATSERRWSRVFPLGYDVDASHGLLVGPDVDGDACRDVFFAASESRAAGQILVEALSGASGATAWRAGDAAYGDADVPGRALRQFGWWRAARGGWPHLFVRTGWRNQDYSGDEHWRGRRVTTWSAGTGEPGGVGLAVAAARAVDFDHDGLEELLTVAMPDENGLRRLEIVRGVATAWRTQGRTAVRREDADADGVDEVSVSESDDDAEFLRGGRTGAVLSPNSAARKNSPSRETRPASAAWSFDRDGRLVPTPGILDRATDPSTSLAFDVDDDGVAESLQPHVAPEDPSRIVLSARRARDGSDVWHAEILLGESSTPAEGTWRFMEMGVIALPRTEFDEPLIACWRLASAGPPDDHPTPPRRLQASAFNPRDGRRVFAWEHPADFADGLAANVRTFEWIPWRRGATRELALWIPALPEAWWSFDARGAARLLPTPLRPADDSTQARGEAPAATRWTPPTLERLHAESDTRLWPIDLDDAPGDEFVLFHDDVALAFSADAPSKALWKRPLATAGFRATSAVTYPDLCRSAAGRPWLTGVDPTGPRAIGVDLRDGAVAWTCPIPPPVTLGEITLLQTTFQYLGQADATGGPYVLWSQAGSARVVQAVRASNDVANRSARKRDPHGDPRILDSSWSDLGLTMTERPPSSVAPDPRWARELPWLPRTNGVIQGGRPTFGEFLGDHRRTWTTAIGVFMIPAWYGVGVLRRRQFTLRQLLVLPVIVLLALAAWRHRMFEATFFGSDPGWRSWLEWATWNLTRSPIALAALHFGLLAAGVRLVRDLRHGARSALLAGSTAWLATSLVAGAGMLAFAGRQLPLAPEEYWSLDGWAWILCDGALIAGWGYWLVLPFRVLAGRLRPRRPPSSDSPRPAPRAADAFEDVARIPGKSGDA